MMRIFQRDLQCEREAQRKDGQPIRTQGRSLTLLPSESTIIPHIVGSQRRANIIAKHEQYCGSAAE